MAQSGLVRPRKAPWIVTPPINCLQIWNGMISKRMVVHNHMHNGLSSYSKAFRPPLRQERSEEHKKNTILRQPGTESELGISVPQKESGKKATKTWGLWARESPRFALRIAGPSKLRRSLRGCLRGPCIEEPVTECTSQRSPGTLSETLSDPPLRVRSLGSGKGVLNPRPFSRGSLEFRDFVILEICPVKRPLS